MDSNDSVSGASPLDAGLQFQSLMLFGIGQVVSLDHRLATFDTDFERLVLGFAAFVNLVENGLEQFALLFRRYLR